MNLNSHRWLVLAATCSLVGCAFVIRPDSSELSNPNISHIRDRTAGVQAEAAKHQLSWAETEKFLHESMGVSEVLRGMDRADGGDQERVAALDRYDARLKSLLARRKPLRSSDAVDLGANIHELAGLFNWRLATSTGGSSDSSSASDSSTDSTETTCTEDERKKEKEKKCDRDGDRKKRDRDCDDDKKRDRH